MVSTGSNSSAKLYYRIKPGMEFEDKDRRPAGRRLRVLSVHPEVIGNPAYARLVNIATGRESGVRLHRLVTEYKFVKDVD